MTRPRFRTALRRTCLLAGSAAVLMGTAALPALPAVGENTPQPVDFTHNVRDAAAPIAGAVFGSGPATRQGRAICTTATQNGTNVNTDCEGVNPHNETSIDVNPTDPSNMIGGANDYQLGVNPGGHVSASVLSRAHVTFDGGRSWSEYPITSNSAYQATGDPAVAFDDSGHAYYATLGFRFVGPVSATNPDVLVADSGDKGRTWRVSRVAAGTGSAGSVGHLLDKEYIAAWGDGNAIVTYGNFQLAQRGSFISAQIYATVTHDAGKTWSTPRLISGSLDQAFVSVPTVTANGAVFVAFLNTTHLASGRDDYEVVQVDPQTGSRIAGPFKVATVIDGFNDYPVALGRPAYQDSIFRTWAAGNITADPTNAAHLAVVWSDMRNTPHPVPSDPYVAKTNSDVIVSESFDRGRTWSVPVAIQASGDQFMPWGAYDTSGQLRIGTFDRSTDPVNHRYNYSLTTEDPVGTLHFAGLSPISTATSDPTKNDRWFATTLNPAFPYATSFMGDYSNIAATPNGGVVAYWTDMRQQACFLTRCGHGQDAYFAAAP